MVVVVSAFSTVCAAGAELGLALKPESPTYVAVSDFAPTEPNAIVHWPAATVAVHDWLPSLTVTLPVGVPAPGASTNTLKATVTCCPTTEGSGSSDAIDVVVSALFTWCGATADVLPLKFASPA